MANNYTVSNSTTTESTGDSVANGTLPSSSTLVITPNGGYTLQASDFFIGSILPAEVISVSFADSGTALDPANTIIATVTLASWYVMPNASTGISVDIDGRTHTYQPRLSFTNVTNVVTNVTDSLTLSTVTSPAVNSLSSATVGSITTDTSLFIKATCE